MNTDIKELARRLAAKGRHGDSHLLHITPSELEKLKKTGKITTNPDTGLPEAFLGSIGDALGDIGNAVQGGFNRFMNPFSDKNVFRGPAGALFPTQNPLVQIGSGLVGGALLAGGPAAAGAAGGGGGAAAEGLGSLTVGENAASILGVPSASGASPEVLGSGLSQGAGGVTGITPGVAGQGFGSLELGSLASPAALQAPGAGAAEAGNAAGGIKAGAAGANGVSAPGTAAASQGSPAAGGATGAPGAPPPPTNAPGGVVDKMLKQMGDNALSLGLIGGSVALGMSKQQVPQQQNLEGLSAEARKTADQLLQQYRAGQLSAAQQSQLDQLTQQTKNQIAQYFASIGQSDSTAARQALAQVDQQSFGMRQQMLDNMLQQGLSAIGVASGPLNTIAQAQLGQDNALRQAYGNFAGAIGNLFGRNSGTPTPQQPAPVPAPQGGAAGSTAVVGGQGSPVPVAE